MKKYEELFIATTDTVVGIGAPISEANRKKIMQLKERPEEKKLLVMVSSIAEARTFAGWNANAEAIAQKYWPGQVTIVLDEIGLRIPDNRGLLNLMDEIGPIYMTSANKSGSTTLKLNEAIKTFPEIHKHYNFGHGTNVSSTIVRASNMSIIRRGSVKIKLD